MTEFVKHHSWRSSLTRCPRCAAQPGSADGPTSWLQELTIVDGMRSVHAVLCRRPSCGFAEIIGLRADANSTPSPRRRSWMRDALAERPGTFVLGALVHGIAIGALVALR